MLEVARQAGVSRPMVWRWQQRFAEEGLPNRPARFTNADLRRTVQIAKEGGRGWFVEILPDGTIRIAQGRPPETPPEPRERVVLW